MTLSDDLDIAIKIGWLIIIVVVIVIIVFSWSSVMNFLNPHAADATGDGSWVNKINDFIKKLLGG